MYKCNLLFPKNVKKTLVFESVMMSSVAIFDFHHNCASAGKYNYFHPIWLIF